MSLKFPFRLPPSLFLPSTSPLSLQRFPPCQHPSSPPYRMFSHSPLPSSSDPPILMPHVSILIDPLLPFDPKDFTEKIPKIPSHSPLPIPPMANEKGAPRKIISLIFLHCLLANHSLFTRNIPFLRSLVNSVNSVFSVSPTPHPPPSPPPLLRMSFLDIRNHSHAEFHSKHSYEHLINDIQHFMNFHRLSNSSSPPANLSVLIGHSMGAKISLAFALSKHSEINGIDGVVSLDASPAVYSHSHGKIFDSLRHFHSEALRGNSPPPLTLPRLRQILRENFHLDANDTAFITQYAFKQTGEGEGVNYQLNVNVDALLVGEKEIHGFPFGFHGDSKALPKPFENPSLFIGGTKSTRLTEKSYLKDLSEMFPKNQLEIVSAGHFVMNEKPKECGEFIGNFIHKIHNENTKKKKP